MVTFIFIIKREGRLWLQQRNTISLATSARAPPREWQFKSTNKRRQASNFPITMLMCKVDLSGVVTRALNFKYGEIRRNQRALDNQQFNLAVHARGSETAGASYMWQLND